MLLLTNNEVKNLLTMQEAISVVEKAFKYYSNHKAVVPNRTQIEMSDKKSIALFMPGCSESMHSLGLKIATIFPNNVNLGLKTTNAVILLNNLDTGEPIALIGASNLTALRTGAASGVATKYLAKENSCKVTIIGTGDQAITQLEAMCCVRNINEVKVYDLNLTRAKTYIEIMKKRLNKKNIHFILTNSSKEAVLDADIICTTTTTKKPLFKMQYLKIGVHINAIGGFTPSMQEIDEEIVVKADKICVDSLESALEEAGDLIIPINKGLICKQDIYCEIGKIIDGSKVGRENDNEMTLFKTVGISIQDIAVAMFVYQKAKDLKIGKEFTI